MGVEGVVLMIVQLASWISSSLKVVGNGDGEDNGMLYESGSLEDGGNDCEEVKSVISLNWVVLPEDEEAMYLAASESLLNSECVIINSN